MVTEGHKRGNEGIPRERGRGIQINHRGQSHSVAITARRIEGRRSEPKYEISSIGARTDTAIAHGSTVEIVRGERIEMREQACVERTRSLRRPKGEVSAQALSTPALGSSRESARRDIEQLGIASGRIESMSHRIENGVTSASRLARVRQRKLPTCERSCGLTFGREPAKFGRK